MAFKQKGFPMHSTSSALKQIVDEPVVTEETVVTGEGEWVPDPSIKGLGNYERNTVTGKTRLSPTNPGVSQEKSKVEFSPENQKLMNDLITQKEALLELSTWTEEQDAQYENILTQIRDLRIASRTK